METYLGSNIEFLRKKRSLTQTELAALLGKQKSAIGTYENGHSFPPLDTIDELSKLFDISLDDLIYKDIRSDYSQISLLVALIEKVLRVVSDRETKIELITAKAGSLEALDDKELLHLIRLLMEQLRDNAKIIRLYNHLSKLLLEYGVDGRLP